MIKQKEDTTNKNKIYSSFQNFVKKAKISDDQMPNEPKSLNDQTNVR